MLASESTGGEASLAAGPIGGHQLNLIRMIFSTFDGDDVELRFREAREIERSAECRMTCFGNELRGLMLIDQL